MKHQQTDKDYFDILDIPGCWHTFEHGVSTDKDTYECFAEYDCGLFLNIRISEDFPHQADILRAYHSWHHQNCKKESELWSVRITEELRILSDALCSIDCIHSGEE